MSAALHSAAEDHTVALHSAAEDHTVALQSAAEDHTVCSTTLDAFGGKESRFELDGRQLRLPNTTTYSL